MKNLKIAFLFISLFAVINLSISGACYLFIGMTEFKGYVVGTALSYLLSLLWVLGARKGMKSNTMVLLGITLGGFPVRLALLGLFAFGGLYIIKMSTMHFAIAFLVGTILSLVVEIWFFNTMTMPGRKKLQ
ncbi:MAG TPA: hypothetical protein PKO25_02645 [Spirochaetota bacterium]|mgnify:FL=1|jgi:hypothetical protein|nr:hypothetical protein [Spirochaetota bacterium]OPZ37175.1 MAG: hypothetical protein BWY96_01823 [Spirochaetes bacterium ADurb.BinA120]HNU90748.1 hypothetical protein [Spirochaetota bacterium]HPI14558.1 hypothetical protein [Spirochaetota bacterium]